MLNSIICMGRLTKAPELRYTQSQVPVVTFTIACERDYAERGQDRQTDFIDCVAWRGTAEFVHQYFDKGSMAIVNGRLQSRDWTDREGGKRRSWEIIADYVYFGETKRQRDENNYAAAEQEGKFTPAGAAVDAGPSSFSDLEDADGKLPF